MSKEKVPKVKTNEQTENFPLFKPYQVFLRFIGASIRQFNAIIFTLEVAENWSLI